MNLADKLKARVINHTEKNLLIEELKQLSTFDYSEINEDDKHFLIKTEKTILDLGENFKNITIEIGKNLFNAQQKLASYTGGTFMKWYQSLGLNKDNVSYFLKRYTLFLDYKDKENYIANMPVTMVKALTHRDIPQKLVAEVIENEIKTTKEFNEIKKKFNDSSSHSEHIQDNNSYQQNIEPPKTKKEQLDELLMSYVDHERLQELSEKILAIFKK